MRSGDMEKAGKGELTPEQAEDVRQAESRALQDKLFKHQQEENAKLKDRPRW